MSEPIGPISAETRLAQLIGDNEFFAQAPAVAPAAPAGLPGSPSVARTGLTGNAFDDILNKTIEALNGVSRSEFYANQLAEKYVHGQAELQDVMVAQAKMSVMTTLAVTTVNSAVNTFKEITQIQI
ncbi:MAG: flagellar hook-basal body complex protein FliE [Candidatus Margulisbacteria bacterium]|nr:flagellar hook-basal body complex protein FliE [Candidatus Margulisiibacteriota bacterium]